MSRHIVLDLVCSACGFRCCAQGVQMCERARSAGFCTLEEYEARHAGDSDNRSEPKEKRVD